MLLMVYHVLRMCDESLFIVFIRESYPVKTNVSALLWILASFWAALFLTNGLMCCFSTSPIYNMDIKKDINCIPMYKCIYTQLFLWIYYMSEISLSYLILYSLWNMLKALCTNTSNTPGISASSIICNCLPVFEQGRMITYAIIIIYW
jgi:hypothetical protein